ncbi:MAG: hypothetical protein HQ596_06055 [Candidatus Saganbacteria bacterium]|nr:hypothetical protein [Candidatus Saganbacteria bacterium]
MRKVIVFFIALFLAAITAFSALTNTKAIEQLKGQIAQTRGIIESLEKRRWKIDFLERKVLLWLAIERSNNRLKEMQGELDYLMARVLEEELVEEIVISEELSLEEGTIKAEELTLEVEALATFEVGPEILAGSEEVVIYEEEVVRQPSQIEIGATVGIFANSTSFFPEIRLPLSYIVGPALSSLRISGGIAQSMDTQRRYVPLSVDFILNYPPGWFSGVENYLGVGVNFVVLTTGWKTGSLGGEVFYGIDSSGFGGKIFGELGYGFLNSGAFPSQRGATLLIGYRRKINF